jgi:hypothetical protein
MRLLRKSNVPDSLSPTGLIWRAEVQRAIIERGSKGTRHVVVSIPGPKGS